MNTAKKQSTHAFTQYELTNNLLNNLSQFKLTPTAKLVLLYLSSCYNSKNKEVFPKQKTMANKIGVTERSVTRAISELVKAGLIIIECKYKYINHYRFSSRIVSERAENLSNSSRQNSIKQYDNLSLYNKQHEQVKNKLVNMGGNVYSIDEEKTLRDYAVKHNAKNIQAYVKALKSSGSAIKIIENSKNKMVVNSEITQKYLQNEAEYHKTSIPATEWEGFKALGEKLKNLKTTQRC